MKPITTILVIALVILLVSMPVTGAKDNPGNNADNAGPSYENPGQGQNVRETIREENQIENTMGLGAGTPAENRTQDRAEVYIIKTAPGQNITVIHATIRQNRNLMNATLQNANPVRAGWSTNANEVRLAVHTLLAMEDINGGIGPQVSLIARDFNNSAQNTWQLEERIQNRDAISRFFFGGDQVSAAELANLTTQNQNRIRQMEQLMNSEQMDAETRAMLEEQIQILQQENTRLGQVASTEQQNRGLLGWFGK
ncbi:MAG: hypothetical protein Q7J03_02800 [Methanoregula sp.]|nr:hypothetical protein [Methanoregula sp.]